jgi:hypothetical protein
MRRIYSSRDTLAVDQRHDLLERAGIVSQVRQRDLIGLAGLVPANECWVELWVLDDEDVADAEAVLAAVADAPDDSDADGWRCRRCGESSTGAFDACWHCGAPRLVSATAPPPFTPISEPPVDSEAARTARREFGFWMLLVALATVAYWMLRAYTRPWE